MAAPRIADTPWTPAALHEFRRRFPNSRGPVLLADDAESERCKELRQNISQLNRREEELRLRIAELEAQIRIQVLEEKQAEIQEAKRRVARAEILKLVSECTRIRPEDIRGPRRERGYAEARQVCMWLVRKWCPDASLPQIGRWMGRRDHSTVVHGVRKIEENKDRFADVIAYVEARIRADFSTGSVNSVDSASKGYPGDTEMISTCHAQPKEAS
jgi:chromosomal replication initiator protein